MTNANSTDATESGSLKRRNFLLSAGLGIGGAVAAAAGVKAVIKEPPAGAAVVQPQDQGYRASAHVRNYYRTARV